VTELKRRQKPKAPLPERAAAARYRIDGNAPNAKGEVPSDLASQKSRCNFRQAFGASFFQVRFGALTTMPFFSAFAVTRMYRTSPLINAFTRCRFGRNRRFVIAVTCVPMPPFFLALPLRQM
jgi:hypothetical protein